MSDPGAVEAKPIPTQPETRPTTGVGGNGQKLAPAERQSIADQAEMGVNGTKPSTEALAGIAGWRFMGVISQNIESTVKTVNDLYTQGKINQEQANGMLTRVIGLRQKIDQAVYPRLERLGQVAEGAEKSGKTDLFLLDLDIHSTQEELRLAEKASDEAHIQQLKKDLQASEAQRAGVKDENGQTPVDTVLHFAQDLAGEKQLPTEFQSLPLSFIENFFQKDFPKIIGNEKARVKLASRLGIDPGKLLELGGTYQLQEAINNQFEKIQDDIHDLENPGQKKTKEWGKRGLRFGGILGAIMALMMYRAIKQEGQAQSQA